MSLNHSSVMSDEVRRAYAEGEEDETLKPRVLFHGSGPVGRIQKSDSVIFYNIRGEREIELTRSLVEKDFHEFAVERGMDLHLTTMIEYQKGLPVEVAFPPEGVIGDTLGEVLSRHGLRQAKITEAEKAVHVLYFLNGKNEDPIPGEERIIVPTRKDVALFDEAPEMSIQAITETAIGKIQDRNCDVVFVNFPNVDVVGHIENEAAVIAAVEAVDSHVGRVIEEAVKAGLDVVVTADHGTVEKWFYPDGAVDTGHTDSPVPFILISGNGGMSLRAEGELADAAPTVLDLLAIPKPAVMTGRSLIEKRGARSVSRPRLLFIILDGWGLNDDSAGNLISKARTPVMDRLWNGCARASLRASGEAVGLPKGTVGNSEVGHLHIGAGRRVYSDRARIDRAIEDGSFFRNEAFLRAMRVARDRGRALHLMGIVSFFSSHGSVKHLFALTDLAAKEGLKEIYVHAMLGRRGEQPESGANYIGMIEKKCRETGLGQVVSVIGRYWSMDREENWDRIEKTYRMLVYGAGNPVQDKEGVMEIRIKDAVLSLVEGDLTKEETEAIVNAANSMLAGGGGVDGAIHRAGGPSIMEECRKIGGCPTGKAVITTGGNLKARHVIHTVGPVYRDGTRGEAELLGSAYRESLELASRHGLKSIAFPSISTGAYGYPLEQAAAVSLKTVMDYLKAHQDIRLVRFVLFGRSTYDVFAAEFTKLMKS